MECARRSARFENKKGRLELARYTSGSRINARDFTQRGSDADDDERDQDPSPDNIDRATSQQRVV